MARRARDEQPSTVGALYRSLPTTMMLDQLIVAMSVVADQAFRRLADPTDTDIKMSLPGAQAWRSEVDEKVEQRVVDLCSRDDLAEPWVDDVSLASADRPGFVALPLSCGLTHESPVPRVIIGANPVVGDIMHHFVRYASAGCCAMQVLLLRFIYYYNSIIHKMGKPRPSFGTDAAAMVRCMIAVCRLSQRLKAFADTRASKLLSAADRVHNKAFAAPRAWLQAPALSGATPGPHDLTRWTAFTNQERLPPNMRSLFGSGSGDREVAVRQDVSAMVTALLFGVRQTISDVTEHVTRGLTARACQVVDISLEPPSGVYATPTMLMSDGTSPVVGSTDNTNVPPSTIPSDMSWVRITNGHQLIWDARAYVSEPQRVEGWTFTLWTPNGSPVVQRMPSLERIARTFPGPAEDAPFVTPPCVHIPRVNAASLVRILERTEVYTPAAHDTALLFADIYSKSIHLNEELSEEL